jgi:hypothetical protein
MEHQKSYITKKFTPTNIFLLTCSYATSAVPPQSTQLMPTSSNACMPSTVVMPSRFIDPITSPSYSLHKNAPHIYISRWTPHDPTSIGLSIAILSFSIYTSTYVCFPLSVLCELIPLPHLSVSSGQISTRKMTPLTLDLSALHGIRVQFVSVQVCVVPIPLVLFRPLSSFGLLSPDASMPQKQMPSRLGLLSKFAPFVSILSWHMIAH